ncbi:MAG: peptidylprolyl isomerase [Prochlorothrix sp.]|nr:peptidylprolyl isomerase [Prochlorothrix sp.]
MTKSFKPLVWLCIVTVALTLGACSGQDVSATSPNVSATETEAAFANLPRLEGTATVELVVNGQTIMMDVYGEDAPLTAGNFVELVNKGFYNGLSFHRVVKEPQPFVAQGGDPNSADPAVPASQLGRGGYVDESGQERMIPLEILPEGAEQPLYSTTFQAAGLEATPKLQHVRGAVAMARSQFPDSASSQFYITLSDWSFLDGNYAVFGYVTQGMEAVDAIQQGDRIESARVIYGLESLVTPEPPAP